MKDSSHSITHKPQVYGVCSTFDPNFKVISVYFTITPAVVTPTARVNIWDYFPVAGEWHHVRKLDFETVVNNCVAEENSLILL